jgi:isocitrate dehydrogenase
MAQVTPITPVVLGDGLGQSVFFAALLVIYQRR